MSPERDLNDAAAQGLKPRGKFERLHAL